jgi:purine-binding chemotaxis protein CheW
VVMLESHGAETAESVFTTEAKYSTLSLELIHESMMRVDAETTFKLIVRNDSAVPANGVTAMLSVPEELVFASAIQGEYDRSLNLVGWLIGTLAPGESRTVSASLRGFAPGLVGIQSRVEGMSGSPTTTMSNVFVEIDARSTSSSLDKLLAAMQEAVPDETVDRVDVRAESGVRHLIFEVAETQYAVDIDNIREVIRPTKVTPVPGMPEWLPGVANIRGDIISIVDLPRFLQVEEAGTHRGLLIAKSDDEQLVIGLLVNNIVGIRRVPPGREITQELLDDNPIAAYLDGITELNGKLVPILDLNVLFNSAELNCFQMA